MALQQIQFLDGNLLNNAGVKINGDVPSISTLFEGSLDYEPMEIGMYRGSFVNLDEFAGVLNYGAFEIDLGFVWRPTNIVLVLKKPRNFRVGADFFIAPGKFSNQVDFERTKVSRVHIAGEEPERVTLYGHIEGTESARYWYVFRQDFLATEVFSLVDGFLGGAVDVQSTISAGLNYQLMDPSILTYTDSGRAYAIRKPKYHMISGLNLPFLSRNQREEIMRFYNRKGITEPFWVAMDPENKWDGPAFGASFGIYRFASPPSFQHNFRDKFSVSMQLREAL